MGLLHRISCLCETGADSRRRRVDRRAYHRSVNRMERRLKVNRRRCETQQRSRVEDLLQFSSILIGLASNRYRHLIEEVGGQSGELIQHRDLTQNSRPWWLSASSLLPLLVTPFRWSHRSARFLGTWRCIYLTSTAWRTHFRWAFPPYSWEQSVRFTSLDHLTTTDAIWMAVLFIFSKDYFIYTCIPLFILGTELLFLFVVCLYFYWTRWVMLTSILILTVNEMVMSLCRDNRENVSLLSI